MRHSVTTLSKIEPRPSQAVILLVALVSLLGEFSRAQSPFTVSPVVTHTNGGPVLHLQFGLPANHYLYAEKLSFRWRDESAPALFALPEPLLVLDKFSGEKKKAFTEPFEARFPLQDSWTSNRTLEVRFQGCDGAQCYFPETKTFLVSSAGPTVMAEAGQPTVAEPGTAADWRDQASGFQVVARRSGYVGAKDFLAFLESAQAGKGAGDTAGFSFRRWGWLATLGLILLGGLALNLTPCILPLIPINLAIIGAGAKGNDRRRGFALGATYGAGMATTYGALGLVVVLTGSKFGSLNSSPWFNLAIALVFAVLALGMFDKVAIDFSRFQGRLGEGRRMGTGGSFLLALTMGAVAALLAGACVAPVVISVLLLATQLYNQGAWLGLVLPFFLGLGMALPWPVAGAGLGLLPKPGAWMTKIKYSFGAMIVIFALYYGHLAYTLFEPMKVTARQATPNDPGAEDLASASTEALQAALKQARQDGKPVLVDFWASWCKNCSAMEHTTFNDRAVRRRLESFHQVKFQAERPNQSPARQVLDHFGVMGLPTCVVLASDSARSLSPEGASPKPR